MTVRSMTGFAASEVTLEHANGSQNYCVELRSVNHRHLDVRFKLSRELIPLEPELKAAVKRKLSRGHVNILIEAEALSKPVSNVVVNEPLVEQLGVALKRIQQIAKIEAPVDLQSLLTFPDVIQLQRDTVSPLDDTEAFVAGLEAALDDLIAMREDEGARLAVDLKQRVDTIKQLTSRMEDAAPRLLEEHHSRLETRLNKLVETSDGMDPGRLEREVAILAERSDVTEELTRLNSHCAQFSDELAATPAGSGKKLTFIAQEILRELNTIGSKIGDVEILRHVIDAKLEVEKLKEQVANIE